MGLFDEVRCQYRLPNPAHQSPVFQTKDLENLMDEYVITRRGRLVRTKRGLLAPRPCRMVCPIHQDLRICGSVAVTPEERERSLPRSPQELPPSSFGSLGGLVRPADGRRRGGGSARPAP